MPHASELTLSCPVPPPQALQKATPEQRAVIEAHYGKDEEASVAAVKAVYNELQLEPLFKCVRGWVPA